MGGIWSAAIFVKAVSNFRYGVDSARGAVIANGLDDVVVPVGDANPSELDAKVEVVLSSRIVQGLVAYAGFDVWMEFIVKKPGTTKSRFQAKSRFRLQNLFKTQF